MAIEQEEIVSRPGNGNGGGASGSGDKRQGDRRGGRTGGRRPWIVPAAIGAALAVLVVGYFVWKSANYESTDDAFIDGHIVPIGAKVAGQVLTVAVTDNAAVKAGDVLFEIDAKPFEAKLAEERAKLASADADARKATSDAQRYTQIFKKNEVSKQQVEHAQATAEAATAAVDREKAAVEQAELNLSYCHVTAPMAGRVTRKSVEPGMYVQVGQTLLTLVSDEVWVTANFKETQLSELHAGQPAELRIDAYPSARLSGRVDSVQAGTGARFSLFPPENATGNFVKVVQRVPVKIVLDGDQKDRPFLAPGMSVDARVKVR